MKFLYNEYAGDFNIVLRDDGYRHVFKAKRKSANEILKLRNLKDDYLYDYKVVDITKKEANIVLIKSEKKPILPNKYIHIAWCIVEPKIVEKTLPMLNELGVSKISFVYCKRSQKNFRVDFSRLKRIVINSCEQCGRSNIMEFEEIDSVESYLSLYPQSAVLDFGGKELSKSSDVKDILIGCEGGFEKEERELFQTIYGIDSNLILRSETATVFVASKLL